MKRTGWIWSLSAIFFLAVSGCARTSEDKTEMKSETKTTTAQGESVKTTEATQVGSTLEMTTQTKSDTGKGAVRGKTETFVGTVTKLDPGKHIEVMTGEKKTHAFDLDDKDLTANVDPNVKVGSKVRLVDERGDNQRRTITVNLEAI